MADKSNAEVVAGEIVSYLFDDYPDNNQVRGDAIAEVAKRITTAQSQLAEKVLAEIVQYKGTFALVHGVEGEIIDVTCNQIDQRLRELFTKLGIEIGGK